MCASPSEERRRSGAGRRHGADAGDTDFGRTLFAPASSCAVPCPSRRAGFSLRLALGLGAYLPELRFDHHADEPLSRHVGSRRIRLQGGEQRGGQAQADRRVFARQFEAHLLHAREVVLREVRSFQRLPACIVAFRNLDSRLRGNNIRVRDSDSVPALPRCRPPGIARGGPGCRAVPARLAAGVDRAADRQSIASGRCHASPPVAVCGAADPRVGRRRRGAGRGTRLGADL